jgi:hypothetical protein
MFKMQVTIFTSSCSIKTPWGPTFLLLVLELRWFKSEISGMFQYLVAVHKELCPFSTMSMASSRCWSTHLVCLVALNTLLVLVNICIFNMGKWHCCCVGVWIGYDCGISCIVGVTKVISSGGQLTCFTQVIPKMPFCRLHDTFKCVVMQFVSGAPL